MNYDVKFIPNTKDDLHCLQAAFMMVIKYFNPNFEMDWDEFSRITGFEEGKGTWASAGLLWLNDNGFEVKQFDTFDYEDFARNGGDYLIRHAGNDIGNWQIAHTNLPLEQQRAKQLVNARLWEKRIPAIEDAKKFLKQGYLVTCLVNAFSLNSKEGYFGHQVVVKGFDQKHLYLHDPGLPPVPNRKIGFDEFEKAWADPNPNSKEMNIIKLNT